MRRSLLLVIAAALAALSLLPSLGQDVKKITGRLPAYYGDIVTDDQRKTIYMIQAKYEPQITALQQQIAVMEKQQDAEIENVLKPEQKARLRKLKEDAAARRKKTVDDKKAEELAAKAAPPAPADMKKAAANKKPK
jgi:TolA-binding protein